MKPTLLFIAFVLASVTMLAQGDSNEYRLLVEEGKHWTYDNFMPLRPAKYDHYYYYDLRGDTLIAGKNCLKMYSENQYNDSITRYEGALYEEYKKVYCFYPNKDEAKLLYDFDCEVGDTLHVSAGQMVVKDIQTEDNGDIVIRKYILQWSEVYEDINYREEYDIIWIEGVGATSDFFDMLPFPGNYSSLNACELNDEKLYQKVEPDYTDKGYHKMGIEGKRWNYIHYYLDEDGEHRAPYSYVVKGDTIIRRTTYKKLWYQDEKTERLVCLLLEQGREVLKSLDFGDNSYDTPLMKSFFAFDREDFGRVFTWKAENNSGNTNWMVYGVDTIEVKGQPFRRYTCLQKYSEEGEKLTTIDYDGEDVWHDIWVEGVGSASSGIKDQIPSHEPPVRTPGEYTYFVSCYEDGECIFTADDFNNLTTDDNNTDSDYLPLVKEGKTWHMVKSKGDECNMLEYMLMDGKVVKDGKTYFRLYSKNGEVVHDLGLLREEDQKVYFYDFNMQEEFLLFDYSLKPGDTFETFSYDEHKMVSYKVMSVGDCLEGPEAIYYDYETHRRYLQKWTLCRTDNEFLQKTWVEGIGSFGGPIDNLYDASPISTAVYLAYVDDSDGGLYLPFSFHDTLWKQASGCDLPTGEEDHSGDDYHHQLRYELEGDRLHVYGEVYTQCGPNNYAYFIISPETLLYEELYGDPSIRKYNFVIQEVQPTMDCMALRSTDFYVSGFDPDLNYIIVDNQGEEHQVINKIAQIAYRPMIEDDKVWKVGAEGSGNPVQWVEYFYFDGDTIIDGRTCKQMMRQRYIGTDFPEYDFYSQQPSLDYVGAWYEEDKRVYEYDTTSQKFKLLYDFSLWTNAYWPFDNKIYMVGPRQTGGVKGFKGVYRDVWKYSNNEFYIRSTPWLEGVGGLLGPTINVFDSELADPMWFLMSCTVGDEVIYLNDEYEDGATPEAINARKRLDFTHTIKTKPKAPRKEGTSLQLYGEYNNLQLSINLEPLDEAYTVRITDESDKVFYEKSINAGNIVGLNIDISTYTAGRYTVTVENSQESFTGMFETQTTGIEEIDLMRAGTGASSGWHGACPYTGVFYNLQGQRINSLQKGLYIRGGRKYVK